MTTPIATDEVEATPIRGRVIWSFADQGLSSLTNAGLSIVVARAVGQDAFGAFSLALVTFSFVIGMARAMGVAAGLLCIVVGLVLPDHDARMALLALGLSFPGLLIQD